MIHPHYRHPQRFKTTEVVVCIIENMQKVLTITIPSDILNTVDTVDNGKIKSSVTLEFILCA